MVLPSWVPPIETKPAPGDLLLLQAFVNTWEGDTGVDLLGTDASAERWLASTGLDGSAGRARAVRESIRCLLVHNAGGPEPSLSDLEPLKELAADMAVHPEIEPSGSVVLEVAGLGRLLLIIRDAQRAGTWARLKACRNDDCRWAYYDRSHAARGAWCDMATCGNRIKNRALRSRAKDAASG